MGKLPEFERADMPEKEGGFWKMAGPGAILVGLSIGAGEIVIWPRIAAEFGSSMVWAAVLGVFLQMWLNLEIGRWTIATGETAYTGFVRVWGGFAGIFVLLNVLGWLAPGWGQASGLALKALLVGPDGFGGTTFWTVVTFIGVALILFGPKVAYKGVERTIELLVVIVTLSLLVVAFQVGTRETVGDLFAGIANVPFRDPDMSVKAFFIAIVFAGAGGTANLFYSYYLRDKGLGMGARIPAMENPLRGVNQATGTTGFVYDDTEENAGRFRAWLRHIRLDTGVFFWGLNTFTMLLFIFGALAVLHPKGIVPEGGTLIWDMSQILGEVWGTPGRYLFLIVGLATLFSTQVTVLDGVARSLSDILYSSVPASRKRPLGYWYVLIASLWMVAGCGITWVMEARNVTDLGILFNAAYIGGFAMAIYTPLLLYMNYRYLPKSARPGPVSTFMMIVCCFVYGGFAIACIVWEFGRLTGGAS